MDIKPTKYDWKQLLERLEVGDEVSMPLQQRSNAAKGITRLRSSSPAKLFTTRKLDESIFKIKRLR